MVEPLTIYDYHSGFYLADLEEDYDNIFYAIEYEDHGDTFIIVYTNDDKIFAYGWWDDRYHFGDYIRDHKLFAKEVPRYENPFVYGSYYKWSIPDKIESIIKDYGIEGLSKEYLQSEFDEIMDLLEIAYNTGYEYSWVLLKDDVVKYFQKHDLYSYDNSQRCEKAHWHSKRIHNCRGIAAKKDWTKHEQFSCDKVLSVWYDGEWHNSTYDSEDSWQEYPIPYRNIPYTLSDSDEWGICQQIYNYKEVKNYLAQAVLF